jgi:hypothetical protein
MNRSSLHHCSTPPPSNWRFPGEPNLDSRNANLNLQITTEALDCPNFLRSHASIPANLDSSVARQTREGYVDADRDELYGVRGDATLVGHSVTVRCYASERRREEIRKSCELQATRLSRTLRPKFIGLYAEELRKAAMRNTVLAHFLDFNSFANHDRE